MKIRRGLGRASRAWHSACRHLFRRRTQSLMGAHSLGARMFMFLWRWRRVTSAAKLRGEARERSGAAPRRRRMPLSRRDRRAPRRRRVFCGAVTADETWVPPGAKNAFFEAERGKCVRPEEGRRRSVAPVGADPTLRIERCHAPGSSSSNSLTVGPILDVTGCKNPFNAGACGARGGL